MKSLEKEVNEYLFCEFGVAREMSHVSEAWPFKLHKVSEIEGTTIFSFVNDKEEYFALAGRSLEYLPVAGMTVDDLLLQISGSFWIAERDPIDVDTSALGDDSVPSTLKRKQHLQHIAESAFPGAATVVLEGLFLRRTRQYLALVSHGKTGEAHVVCTSLPRLHILFPEASHRRRLAWGVGKWLEEAVTPHGAD